MIVKRQKLYESDYPYFDMYLLDRVNGEQEKHGAVIVIPGGGYEGVSPREGEPVATPFAAAGYHTFVLYYRVSPHKHPSPIQDLAETVKYVRAHAEEFGVDPDDITVCGFSAGGHLAATLGVHWNKPYLTELVQASPETLRPNHVILGYPVITSGPFAHRGSFDHLVGSDEALLAEMSLETQVTPDTAPTFLWHTAEDPAVPVENSLMFASALSANHVPFEMHIYPFGGHGLSRANSLTSEGRPEQEYADVAEWIDLAIRWLKKKK